MTPAAAAEEKIVGMVVADFITIVFLLLLLFNGKGSSNAMMGFNNNGEEAYYGVWNGFRELLDARKGDACSQHQLSRLKDYLQQFGYQNYEDGDLASAEFGNATETAILLYQHNFRLNMTGVLDESTLAQMMKPRCGREDMVDGISFMNHRNSSTHRHQVQHYSFFPNNPKWDKQAILSYAIASNSAQQTGISEDDLSTVFADAFAEWAAIVPMNFSMTSDFDSADIRIEFASGDHGDGKAFDGPLGILAHGFSPEDGRLHFDAAEIWSIDVKSANSKAAVDLKSVAVHEIGHILGLGHSAESEAVMFPNIAARQVKIQLSKDDVNGAQSLYGANPNYNPSFLSNNAKIQPENGTPSSPSSSSSSSSRHVPLLLLLLLVLAAMVVAQAEIL